MIPNHNAPHTMGTFRQPPAGNLDTGQPWQGPLQDCSLVLLVVNGLLEPQLVIKLFHCDQTIKKQTNKQTFAIGHNVIALANYGPPNVTCSQSRIHPFKFSHLIQNNLLTTPFPLGPFSRLVQKLQADRSVIETLHHLPKLITAAFGIK